jgi:hypothetical protein
MGRSDLGTLPAGERVFVDSNILTYYLLNHRRYGMVCSKFMQYVQDDKYCGCLTPKSILNFTIRFFLLLQEKRIIKDEI